MKKILAVSLSAAIFCTSGAIPAVYAEDTPAVYSVGTGSANIAKASFGETTETSNIAKVVLAGKSAVTKKNGEWVYQIDKLSVKGENSYQNGRIYIDLDDSFFCGNTDGSQFAVTVEYLDSGSTNFNIKYDGLDNNRYNYISSGYTQGRKISETDTVYASNSGMFKKHRFVISDANFANGLDGIQTDGGKYDLEIGYAVYKRGATARSTYIKSVSIERIPAKNPVMVKIHSDVAGHTFNFKDTPSFEHTFKNYSADTKTVAVNYTAKDKLGNTEWQMTENLTFAPGEEKVITKNPQIDTYGLYSYYVDIPEFAYRQETQFSYVNTSRDGLFNDRFGYSTHFNETPVEDLQGEIEVMKKSNSRSNRDEIVWAWNVGTDGKYHMSHAGIPIEYSKKNDIDTIWVLGYGHRTYTGGDGNMPQTEDEINAFVQYIDYLIENHIGENAKIELWNEPNGDYKNLDGKAEKYAKYITAVANKVKKDHPNVRIGALSLCGIASDSTHRVTEFTQAAIDAGAFENIEAGTFHPYENGAPESMTFINSTMKLANMIKEKARPDIKLWHTELGWSTAVKDYSMITPRQQSAYHQRYYILWDAIPEMEYYMVYDLMKDGNLRDETEDLYGIIDHFAAPQSDVPLLATEAYVGVTNMNNILAGAGKPEKIETGVSDVYAYKYRNEERSKDILTIWRGSDNTNTAVSVNLGVNSVTYVDSYGNETVLESDSGVYNIVPDFELSYLVGNFSNAEIGSSDLKVSALNIDAVSNGAVKMNISGISDASSVEVLEDNFVKLSGNSKVSDKKANIRLSVPELDENKTSFHLLLKDGDKVRTVIRVYMDKHDFVGAGFEDDFSNYEYDVDENTNNRIDKWYIEAGNNASCGSCVRREDLLDRAGNTLEDALAILPTKDMSSLTEKSIRGGRGWTDTIMPGETVTVEFDIYAEDSSEFGIGFSDPNGKVEDSYGRFIMRLCAETEADENGNKYYGDKLYRPGTQNPWAAKNTKLDDITFVRNEVNHIKAEYTLNENVTTNSGDTMKLTVSNSAGENQTQTVKTYYRNMALRDDGVTYSEGIPLTAINGISFVKWDQTSKVCLDNVKVYRSNEDKNRQNYLMDDFSEFDYIFPQNNKDDGTNTWRIETGDNQNVADYVTTESITDSKGKSMESALKILPTKDAVFPVGTNTIRGGRKWSDEIGAGETIVVELDILAEDDVDFQLGLVPSSRSMAEDGAGCSLFRIQKSATSGVEKYYNTRLYYGNSQNPYSPSITYMRKENSLTALKFVRNEVNHLKIEYTMNTSLYDSNGSGTKDKMVVTLTNSEGEQKSGTISTSYRSAASEGPALDGIRGIAFYKFDTVGNVYIDNIEVYKPDITRPYAEISVADVTEGASSVKVTFTKPMNEASLAGITITDSNNVKLSTTPVLSEDAKVYTINADFKAGMEYTVNVPKTVKDSEGIYLSDATEAKFVAKTLSTGLYLTKNGVEIAVSDISEGDEITINAATEESKNGMTMQVLFAGYDSSGRLTSRSMHQITAAKKANKVTVTAGSGTYYKVFLWNILTGEPYCNNL